MPHDHGHHHRHVDPGAGDRRVALAVLANVALTAVQVVGGLLAGSLSLIADALHNLSDALSLVIAFAARRIARRPADAVMTFGYARAETVAALINYTTLIVIGLYLLYEAAMRFADPTPIDGWIVVAVAALALVVDLVTAALTYALSKQSMNIRAAFLHNLADALGSVGVMVAGAGAILFELHILDPLITVAIAGYILWHAGAEVGGVIRVLMLGAPPAIAAETVLSSMRAVPGVAGVHHLHLWQMDESVAAVEAHVTLDEGCWSQADAIKQTLRERLRGCGVEHATLELECNRHACDGAKVIGHN